MFLSLRLVYISYILSILWQNALTIAVRKHRDPLYRLGWAVLCKFQPISFDCSLNDTSDARFFYDIKLKECNTFEFSDCEPSYNNFMSVSSCNSQCRWSGEEILKADFPPSVYCRFQPAFGDCYAYYPMYYFDVSERKCKGFSYSGCGGNGNRFANSRMCAAICSTAVPHPKLQIIEEI